MPSFAFSDALPILERTPRVLRELFHGLPAAWLHGRDGPDRWSPVEVLVHLIEAERALWVPRMTVILEGGGSGRFPAFVRDANFDRATTTAVEVLLDEFTEHRGASLAHLRGLALSAGDMARTALHPEFGPVTLEQLLSTWTAHDLAHLTQVTRTMARQYAEAVGPWRQYLRIMRPDET